MIGNEAINKPHYQIRNIIKIIHCLTNGAPSAASDDVPQGDKKRLVEIGASLVAPVIITWAVITLPIQVNRPNKASSMRRNLHWISYSSSNGTSFLWPY